MERDHFEPRMIVALVEQHDAMRFHLHRRGARTAVPPRAVRRSGSPTPLGEPALPPTPMANINPLVVTAAATPPPSSPRISGSGSSSSTRTSIPGASPPTVGCIPSKALYVAKPARRGEACVAVGIDFGAAPDNRHQSAARLRAGIVDRLTGGLGLTGSARSPTFPGPRPALPVDAHTRRSRSPRARPGRALREVDRRNRLHVPQTTLPNLSIGPERLLDRCARDEEGPHEPAGRWRVHRPRTGNGLRGPRLEVTVVEMLDRLPGADRDCVNILGRRIKAICKQVLTSTKVGMVEQADSGASSLRSGAEDTGVQPGARRMARTERQRPWHRDDRCRGDTARLHHRRCSAARPCRTSTRLATWRATRCSARPSTPRSRWSTSRATRWPSSRRISGRRFHQSGTRLVRPHRSRGAGARHPRSRWRSSPGARPGAQTTVDRNNRLVDHRAWHRARAGRGHRRAQRRRTDCRGRAGRRDGRHGVGPQDDHPREPTLSETVMEAAEVYFGTATNFYKPKKG